MERESLEVRHQRMHDQTPLAEKVQSAKEAAEFGIYEYTRVAPDQFTPFGSPMTVHTTQQPHEFGYLTRDMMDGGDYCPTDCPVGTVLHVAPSVNQFRVFGFVLPNGEHYHLTGT